MVYENYYANVNKFNEKLTLLNSNYSIKVFIFFMQKLFLNEMNLVLS